MGPEKAWPPIRWVVGALTSGLAVTVILISTGLSIIAALLIGVTASSALPSAAIYVLGTGLVMGALIVSTIIAAHGAMAAYRWSITSNRRSLLVIGLAALCIGIADFPSTRASTKTPSTDDSHVTSFAQPHTGVLGDCLVKLQTDEEQKVSAWVRNHHSEIPFDEVRDLVRDVMLDVCLVHVESRYTKVGAAFQTAVQNRATDWQKHRRARCSAIEIPVMCPPSPDEGARVNCEIRIAKDARCRETEDDQEILMLRIIDELPFADIGARFGISADEARARYHNALNRIQAHVDDILNPK